MALELAIFRQKSHKFRTPIHQISLFTTFNTLNNFFLYRTQKQTNMSLFITFNEIFFPLALNHCSL